ncbi:unnamed protein product [Echinostoma caproni]|uniref:Uncharacterized protein n=1 Tax=Echinostoma caproni TaxID=27848 RepID=A0A183AXP0_9TREM|nr:unnamed protein product [Echinostoma caproni]
MSSFVYKGGCEDQTYVVRNKSTKVNPDLYTQSPENLSTRISTTEQCYKELEEVKKHVACKSEVTKHFQGDVVPSCTLPCTFFSYETDRSTSMWPTKSWQLSWLGTKVGRMLINRPNMENYRRARELLNVAGGEEEAQKILSSSTVLEQNLLAIMFIRPNFNLHNVSQQSQSNSALSGFYTCFTPKSLLKNFF